MNKNIHLMENENAFKVLSRVKELEKKGEKIKELHNKIAEEEEKILQYLIELEEEGLNRSENIVLPNPSYFPILLAAGLPFLGYAVIYKSIPLALIGALFLLIGGFGWGTEPLEEEVEEDLEHE